MSSTGFLLVVAALLVTCLAVATPAEAHPFFRGRNRWSRWWQRRYSPPAPTTPTTTTPSSQCTCGAPSTSVAGSAADVQYPEPDDCILPLAAIMGSCSEFLPSSSSSSSSYAAAPSPGSHCCVAMASFFNSGNDVAVSRHLRCLCPYINGEHINGEAAGTMMYNPMDIINMILNLPGACGVVLSPRVVIPNCRNASSAFGHV